MLRRSMLTRCERCGWRRRASKCDPEPDLSRRDWTMRWWTGDFAVSWRNRLCSSRPQSSSLY